MTLLEAEVDSACWNNPAEKFWLLGKSRFTVQMIHPELETRGYKASRCSHILDFLLQYTRPAEAGQLTQEIGTGYLAFVEAMKSRAVVLKQSGGFSIIIIWVYWKKKKRRGKRMGTVEQNLIWLQLVKLHRLCWIYIRAASDLHLFKFTSNVPFEPGNLENLGAFDAIPKQYKGEPVLIGTASLAFNATLKRWQRAVADLSFLSMLPSLW